MPGKAEVTVALEPVGDGGDGGAAPTAKQKSCPFVLKKVMDIPPPNILEEGDDEIEKEKLCSSEDAEGGGAGAATTGAGSGGGGGVSASLTPAIWEKTIPYDGETFHLEYMDLDEFLLENGIPVTLEEEELHKSLPPAAAGKEKLVPKVPAAATTTTTTTTTAAASGAAMLPLAPAAADATVSAASEPSSSAAAPSPVVKSEEPEEVVTVTTLQPAKLDDDDDEEEEEEEEVEEEEDGQEEESVAEVAKVDAPLRGKRTERNTPSPIDPDAIEVDINFQPDPTDLVLSSVPGGELFNPRKHKFSDEELKPQPMIKKAKKVFVPDEQKDEKYWSRRKKNNVAAKRSRDARRLKENQITVRASFLERENAALRQQVAELRKDCGRCKSILARYEAKYGPL